MRRQLVEVDKSGWKIPLLVGRQGIYPILANAKVAMECAREFDGVLAYNSFKETPVFLKDCPLADATVGMVVNDHHVRMITNWLQRIGIRVSVDTCGAAIYTVAQNSSR